MIDVYKYDPQTGEYLGSRKIARRRKSRSEPDELLIIGPYTITPPPAKSQKHRALVWNKAATEWSEVPDYRGVQVWSKRSKERVTMELGQELAEELTLEDPVEVKAPGETDKP